ncbi:hypothetical protein [Actinomyces sp.]
MAWRVVSMPGQALPPPFGTLHTGGVVAPLPARADRLLLHG